MGGLKVLGVLVVLWLMIETLIVAAKWDVERLHHVGCLRVGTCAH